MGKQKLFSVIKIGGFAFSIAVCLLIFRYVQHELSYDNFYPQSDQLYRLVGEASREGEILRGVAMPAPAGPSLKTEFPAIEEAARMLSNPLFGAGSNQVSTIDLPESISDKGFTYADPTIFDLFPMRALHGSLAHALDKPMTIVITKSKAEKYFKGSPLGKTINLNNDPSKIYTITAVIADVPSNSHLYGFDFFMTLKGVNFYDGEQENWIASNYTTFIKVGKNTNTELLAQQITKSYIETHFIPALTNAKMSINPIMKSMKLTLQPIGKVHLYSSDIRDYQLETQHRGDSQVVWIFAGIAIFILLIACINFINLSTANAATRAKEIGIRKAVGSSRQALIGQFITESILYSMISVGLGILLSILLLPLFNNLAGKTLEIPWLDTYFLPSALLVSIFLGAIAGLYPALYLSSFQPIAVLKGHFSTKSQNATARNGLVVFQFTTSIILIIGTILINQQLNFILHKDLGFTKDQLLVLQGTHTLGSQLNSFKQEIKALPSVDQVSISEYLPVRMDGSKRNGNAFWELGKQNTEAGKGGQFWIVDADYIPTFQLKLNAGRNFNMQMPTDSVGAIVNQKMVDILQLKNPIGAQITNGNTYTIIGVVDDFIFESMRAEATEPLCMIIGGSPGLISVRVNNLDMERNIKEIQQIWDKFSPNQRFNYSFMDEGYAALYADVQRTQHIFTAFTSIAICIACLGLFGLAAFITQQRTKEIGIRKVLGAGILRIVHLLSVDFLKLIFIALAIAIPIAWWGIDNWLQDFKSHITIHWWVFLMAGIFAIFIALATICYHALKTALANPIQSLRDD